MGMGGYRSMDSSCGSMGGSMGGRMGMGGDKYTADTMGSCGNMNGGMGGDMSPMAMPKTPWDIFLHMHKMQMGMMNGMTGGCDCKNNEEKYMETETEKKMGELCKNADATGKASIFLRPWDFFVHCCKSVHFPEKEYKFQVRENEFGL